ncbi:hypothetical protein KEJ25_09485 [Candidatus Bathyarchaeota archaeon]|nr:hypothetical protein [Candidatus Bathyarchaeota archaeon]
MKIYQKRKALSERLKFTAFKHRWLILIKGRLSNTSKPASVFLEGLNISKSFYLLDHMWSL